MENISNDRAVVIVIFVKRIHGTDSNYSTLNFR